MDKKKKVVSEILNTFCPIKKNPTERKSPHFLTKLSTWAFFFLLFSFSFLSLFCFRNLLLLNRFFSLIYYQKNLSSTKTNKLADKKCLILQKKKKKGKKASTQVVFYFYDAYTAHQSPTLPSLSLPLNNPFPYHWTTWLPVCFFLTKQQTMNVCLMLEHRIVPSL